MAHIRLIARPRGVLRRYAWRYSRRASGSVVEPVRAAAHHAAKLQQMPRWRESAASDDRERIALEFAEAVTLTPAHVPGELAQEET